MYFDVTSIITLHLIHIADFCSGGLRISTPRFDPSLSKLRCNHAYNVNHDDDECPNDRSCNHLHIGPLIQRRNISTGVPVYPTTDDISEAPCICCFTAHVPGPRFNVCNGVVTFSGSSEVLPVFETKLKNAIEPLDFVSVPCMT